MVRQKQKMPDPEASGLIRTLNKMGWMTPSLDSFSKKIIDFVPDAPGPFLEIGAAYGVAVLAALQKGGQVIANDLDPVHLDILMDRVPPSDRHRLQLLPGRFPDELKIEPNSIGAILVCRVLHFFRGEAIEAAMGSLFDWLAPGGKVAIVADTPYLKNFRARIPIYEQLKKEGHPWPGLVENVADYSPERGKNIPPFMNYLDPDILARVLTQAGFTIEEISTFPRTDYPEDIRLDGREGLGAIAVKNPSPL